MSSNEARQIVEDGLEKKKLERAQRDAALEDQARQLRLTINDNHQDANKAEVKKQQKLMDDDRKRREAWAKKRAERVARDMAAEQAVNYYGVLCLVILLVAAIFRLNFFVSMALVLGMAAVFAAYIYRIYCPFKEVKKR